MTYLLGILALTGWLAAALLARQLFRWERQLRAARLRVSFKGRTQMTPRLIDYLVWANRLNGDKAVTGQVIYSKGGTAIALVKPLPRSHGKTVTKTIKEKS